MQFACNREELEERLEWVSKVILPKSIKESFSSILIKTIPPDKLSLYGRNTEMDIETVTKCETDETKSFFVHAKLFKDIIKNLNSDTIIGNLQNKTLNITAEKTFYKIATQDASDFPAMKEISSERELSLNIDLLKDAVNKVIPFIDKSDLKPILSGIFLDIREDEMRFVSTDASRLAVKKLPIKGFNTSVILPALSLDIITDIQSEGDVTIEFSDSKVRFITNNFKVTTSVIQGKFPAYEKVIPTEFVTKLKLDKNTLKESIKRILPITEDRYHPVKFHIKENRLTLNAKSSKGSATDEPSASVDGRNLDIIFSSDYILDFLSVGDGPITISLSGESTPALFSFENDPNFISIIMPMEE